jgi:hypothetical protein
LMSIPIQSLPYWLKPSAAVDLAQLRYGIRPAMRTELQRPTSDATVQRWAGRFRAFPLLDKDRFLVVSRSPGLSRRVLDLDRRPGDHTYALGLMLGYPRCCCRAAAQVGDEALDAWSETRSKNAFHGRFKAIDPRGYRDGRALISHIPCSARCLPSLQMADALLQRLLRPDKLGDGSVRPTSRECR